VTFPKNHEFAGTTLFFELKVHAIHKVLLPEWDEKFAKVVDPKFDLQGLNQFVVDNIQNSLTEKRKRKEIDAINYALLSIAEFSTIPSNLMKSYAVQHYQQQHQVFFLFFFLTCPSLS